MRVRQNLRGTSSCRFAATAICFQDYSMLLQMRRFTARGVTAGGIPQTLDGPFSAVWTPIFVTKHSFRSISRDLQDLHSGFRFLHRSKFKKLGTFRCIDLYVQIFLSLSARQVRQAVTSMIADISYCKIQPSVPAVKVARWDMVSESSLTCTSVGVRPMHTMKNTF